MSVVRLTEGALQAWVERLIAKQRVIGVQAKDDHFVYDDLKRAGDLRLDHDVTLLPPVRFLLPVSEELMTYDQKGYESVRDDEPFILLGVHPYDLVAIHQMDKVFAQGHLDPHYMERRAHSTIIACDVETPSKNCFAGEMGTATVQDGFDVLLTRIDGAYLAESGTVKGDELLKLAGEDAQAATTMDLDRRARVQELNRQALRKHHLNCSPEDLPKLLAASWDDPAWKERSEQCFSCGSCNMVCGTCYCFDVHDDVNWDLESGTRTRECDGCLLTDFAKVAGGHNFRHRMERYRHRFMRKGLYMPERFGFVACCGCGRCVSACVPNIANPVDMYNCLLENHPEFATRRETVEEAPERDPYLPESATVLKVERLTELETFYEIKLDSGRPLGHEPGQFVEVSLLGIGEAPISICSAPNDKGTFEMVIRKAGSVTEALARLKPGDKIGIRGPMGTSFPVHGAGLHKDIVLIAGGLGCPPLRSVIQYFFSHRSDFGHLTILYGMRQPSDLLFGDEMKEFEKQPGVTVLYTVDHPDESWKGTVGPVTKLLPMVQFDANTEIFVCGPPVMYRFVIADLNKMGVSNDHIWVSLERRMKCGVGKCGHCQMNGLYVCQEGPVFAYSQIQDVPEALS